ncbi:MAG TPA: preprotein translocase subunit SecE [Fimbriimonadaceae bacterium]|nr:preprotein translocase subunit SecE [Fimbriimonadaceae bacterium]
MRTTVRWLYCTRFTLVSEDESSYIEGPSHAIASEAQAGMVSSDIPAFSTAIWRQHMAKSTIKMSSRKSPPPAAPAPGGGVPLPSSKRGFKAFWSEVGRELKKVSWPTRKETNRLTGVVLAVCFLVVTVLTALNYFWATIISLLTRGTV